MPLTDTEFASILEDESKRIRGNITWKEDEDHSAGVGVPGRRRVDERLAASPQGPLQPGRWHADLCSNPED